MRFLKRGEAPQVLSDFDYTIHNWDDHIKPRHRALIWTSLFTMQGERCAYCECSIKKDDPDDKHIEHFRQKGNVLYKHLTFDWSNLFGSCNDGSRCGRFKDKSGVSSEDIIKMDEEDPERFFTFLSNGGVVIKEGLSDAEVRRAEMTLQAFVLNPRRGGVRYERQRVISSHKYLIDEFESILNEFYNLDDGVDYSDLLAESLEEYKEKISGQPFTTAIKHVLMRNWRC